MRKFFTVVIVLCPLLALTSFAQVKVSGTVMDNGHEAIIGASVMERGTTNGTVTDLDGQFTLDVSSPNAVLVFSYVGMQTKEEKLNGRSQLTVTLTDDNKVLDEVVVIGYGTAKRKDITTAVSSVSTEDLEKIPIVSAAQAMQGKAAGVTVVKPNGQPGAGLVVRVRGTTSMNASNDPLYVVDGVPMTDIDFLAPNDIESMQVLKDASSAAIYGSRAANGVIMITTKAGQGPGFECGTAGRSDRQDQLVRRDLPHRFDAELPAERER